MASFIERFISFNTDSLQGQFTDLEGNSVPYCTVKKTSYFN